MDKCKQKCDATLGCGAVSYSEIGDCIMHAAMATTEILMEVQYRCYYKEVGQ